MNRPKYVRDKISKTLSGHKVPKYVREKIANSLLGHRHTKESCRKISIAHKGKKKSLKHCKAISKVRLKMIANGYHPSAETIEKHRNNAKGNKNMLGKKHSFATRKKMRDYIDGEKCLVKGYVRIYFDKHKSGRRFVFGHWLVIEKHFGRLPEYPEQTHHLDENPSNNAIGNLILFRNGGSHQRFHMLGDEGLKSKDIVFDGRKCKK